MPNDSKCCKKHLNNKQTFLPKCINDIEIVSEYTTLSGTELNILLDSLRHAAKNQMRKLGKFSSINDINDEDCKRFTNLNRQQFSTLLNNLKSLKNSPARSKSEALATYLFWLKTGLDFRTISTIFSLDNFQTVGKYCDQVRATMLKDFVPHNLGVSHLSRVE